VGLSLGLRAGLSPAGARGFDPFSLSAALYDVWDAERAETLSLASGTVRAWRSVRHGHAATQTAGASRPSWATAGLNGRPCVSFDGADDELVCDGVGALPTGDEACEIWMLGAQDAPVSDTGVRYAFGYGGGSFLSSRGVRRDVVGGVSRATVLYGAAPSNVIAVAPGSFDGPSVVRIEVTGTQGYAALNGARGAAAAGVATTGDAVVRIGAGAPGTNFFKGRIALIAVTAPLDETQAARMTAGLKARGGVG